MKVVLDTNVILSSYLTEGITHKVFNFCLLHFSIYSSDFIISELSRKLKKKFNVSDNDIKSFVSSIKKVSTLVKPNTVLPDVCRDDSDNHILQLAESVNADLIITGDKDLLSLKHFKSTKIISPRDFFKIYLINT